MDSNFYKVLIFSPHLRPIIGGAERQAEKQAKALARLGHTVTILTPRVDPASPDIEKLDGYTVERFHVYDMSEKIRIKGIGLLNLPFVLLQVAWMVWKRSAKADILHCHIASLYTAGAALGAALRGKKSLCKAAMASDAADFGEITKAMPGSAPLINFLLKKYISCWIATTEAVKTALMSQSVPAHRITNIPNGVELPSTVKTRKDGQVARRFLYVGRLSTNIERDVSTIIYAFALLKKKIPDVRLALVGAGDLFDETKKLVNELGLVNSVDMPGFDDPVKWFCEADCFVLPSRREGLSNALIEAMSYGLPCIANDIPPNYEVLDGGRFGSLVPVGNLEMLLHQMELLATDPLMYESLRAGSLFRIESAYSIESVAVRCVSLYKQVIN